MSDDDSVSDAQAARDQEDEEGAHTDAALSGSEEGSAGHAQGQAGSSPAMEEGSTEGGGTQGAIVTKGKYRSYHLTQNEDTDRISKVTFYYEGNAQVVKKRPADDSSESSLWALLEAQTAKVKRLKRDSDALVKVEEAIYKHRTLKEPIGAPAAAAASGSEGRSATAATADKHVYTTTDNPLPDSVRAELERRYFLQIEEDTKAPDGREFAPSGKSGSLCGNFPHMVMIPSRAKYGVDPVYGVSQHHRLGLRIQLMERKPGVAEPVKASEFELLRYINAQYPQASVAKFGHFEKTLTVYATLEFADDASLVTADCFKLVPPGNAIWSPPESPPYHGGSTERVMEGGHVHFRKLWLNKRVTTSNLDDEMPDQKFRIVVKTLNPILHGLKGFTAKSLPFLIKAVKHNDVDKKQRFVRNPNGQVVVLA